VLTVEGQRIGYRDAAGITSIVRSPHIVGATGRRSVVHRSLGIDVSSATYSRMAGIVLSNVDLPVEGYGTCSSARMDPSSGIELAQGKSGFASMSPSRSGASRSGPPSSSKHTALRSLRLFASRSG